LKCYYCETDCEGKYFIQGDLLVVAHLECATEKVERDGRLPKGENRRSERV
jgi:hypothetical protein